jgi:hypothetical protein
MGTVSAFFQVSFSVAAVAAVEPRRSESPPATLISYNRSCLALTRICVCFACRRLCGQRAAREKLVACLAAARLAGRKMLKRVKLCNATSLPAVSMQDERRPARPSLVAAGQVGPARFAYKHKPII